MNFFDELCLDGKSNNSLLALDSKDFFPTFTKILMFVLQILLYILEFVVELLLMLES